MLRARRNLQPIFAAGGIAAAWGLFEAQWVETRALEVPLDGLPQELDGFTILHLSDLHLGTISLNRKALERIITACGGDPIDYPAKIKCCGFPIIQAREDTALGELIQPIEQAKEAGADAIVTPCPLCHLSLDAWQSKLRKQTGKDFQMPILHLSQLIGVAAGLADSELRFRRHVVSMQPVLEKLAL